MKLLGPALAVLILWFSPLPVRAQTGPAAANITSLPSVAAGCGQHAGSQAVDSTAVANTPVGPGNTPAQATPSPTTQAQDLAGKPVNAGAPRSASDSGNCLSSASDPAPCAKVEFVSFEYGYDGRIFGTLPVWRSASDSDSAFFYESGMTIDADGAPNAYHPDNIGLDDLSNAGGPDSWPGLAKDEHGNPIIQGPNDPYPGYYISATALSDRSKPFNDPTRYVDATKIPFIVLPGGLARQAGARTGDFAVVFNLRNGKSSPAIFADVGPPDHLGEGSIALAENLGIRSDARNGGTRGGVLWLVFAGSGNGRPRPIEEINAEANRLLGAWGGADRLNACMADVSSDR